jgi:hypothetical protein
MKRIITFTLLVLGIAGANAQSNFMISYPIAFPTGDLHTYTSNTSFRGISMEFNKATSPMTTAGLEVGWNVFYQHVDKKAYTDGTITITGVQYRYTNSVPIIVGAKHYLGEKKKSGGQPYVGLGLGTVYSDRSTDFGLYRISTDAWQFCIRPELGWEFPIGHAESLFIGGKYFWSFNTSALDGQSFITLNIGLKASSF